MCRNTVSRAVALRSQTLVCGCHGNTGWLHTPSHPGSPDLITSINNCLNSHTGGAYSRLAFFSFFFLSLSNTSLNLFDLGLCKTQMIEEKSEEEWF